MKEKSMKNQNGEEVSNGRVDDNRSVPSSGSGDVDTPRQYGMAFGYDLRDKSYPVYIHAISDPVGDDVEIGGTVSKKSRWDELEEMRYQRKLSERYEQEYQDDEFWLQFWKSFFRMFWMAFVMVVILYIILALL